MSGVSRLRAGKKFTEDQMKEKKKDRIRKINDAGHDATETSTGVSCKKCGRVLVWRRWAELIRKFKCVKEKG